MRVTLLRLDTGAAFVADAEQVSNKDGSVSFLLPDGQYAGQQPNAYGMRNDNPERKQYQRATRSANVVTFIPTTGSMPCVYLVGEGKVYPA